MLMQIHVRDFATIEELHLNLADGCTMVTGETGAGKSIFIEAIELALGGRASQNIIRAGKDKADVSLCFDISDFPMVIDCLKTIDLYHDQPECIIRRVITVDGRSRCYVNGSPQTVHLVKELGELLFHLHGQHEQQVLLKSETQRDMLDRYAEHLPLALQVKHCAESWRMLADEIKTLQEKMAERNERSEYLRFQLEELQAVQLKPGEWQILESEHKKLSHAEELLHHLQHSLQLITEGEHQTILSLLHDVLKMLEAMQGYEPRAKEWLQSVDSAQIQLSDLASEMQNYMDKTSLDPAALQSIGERVSQIFNLSRKHKIEPEALLQYQEKLLAELTALNESDQVLQKLQEEQQQLEDRYQALAKKLTISRKNAVAMLEKNITQTIRSLSLPHAEFKIALEPEGQVFSPHGHEKIIFLIKTNPDQALQPLAKVISGGELSRLSLAAHLALAHQTNIPTLIFDEVDTGLSGATAEKIGKLLRKLGDSYQVFCVTHQAQVAACGHYHLLVEKYFIGKSTHSRLRLLNGKDKTREIARMLGGEKITKKTLEHAQEMLE